MNQPISRRSMLAATSALAVGSMLPGISFAAPTKMRLSAAFSDTDLRVKAYKAFADALKDDIEIEPHWSNSLFKQGTELVAMQRGNLELCNLAPADISKQVPAWSLLTSAYLFRDYSHLKKTFQSDVGKQFIDMARDQLGVEVIRPVYFGARQVNLKPDKQIKTPADLAGLKMRMPPGEYWQFLGESIGANPTPVAFSELYTALQTGVVDGQDNPLVTDRTMKFYEVTTQFVLTNHVLGYDVLTVAKKSWEGMSKELQAKFRATADKVFDENAAAYDTQEKDAIEYFKSQGKKVYQPDQNAFRDFAQKRYLAKYGDVWPKGAIEKINAIK
ncbi:MAG: TRAP transporter substrate-binding protein DctP [Pseudolabrys sp.]|jgi:tripartite ATP-independent transporter DctP family solute receptor